jgi:hypothetical protein
MKAITLIEPWHLEQQRGSTSYIFWISRAQFLGNAQHHMPVGNRFDDFLT